jgi:hypothetical protein
MAFDEGRRYIEIEPAVAVPDFAVGRKMTTSQTGGRAVACRLPRADGTMPLA